VPNEKLDCVWKGSPPIGRRAAERLLAPACPHDRPQRHLQQPESATLSSLQALRHPHERPYLERPHHTCCRTRRTCSDKSTGLQCSRLACPHERPQRYLQQPETANITDTDFCTNARAPAAVAAPRLQDLPHHHCSAAVSQFELLVLHPRPLPHSNARC
jgi:hypothetical protein